jgi:predicted ABC-class ATPase
MKVVEDEDRAIVYREPGEGSIEHVGVGGSVIQRSVGRSRLAVAFWIVEADLTDAGPGSAPQMLPARIEVDPPQPRVEGVGIAQGVAVAPGRDECLLGCVCGVSLVPEDCE